MNESATVTRSGPFWDFLAGRLPAPPAAATLGWQLSWVAPERGEIEVVFDARESFTNPMGNVQGGFLAAMLDDTLGTGRVVHRGGTIAFLAGELKDRAGELLATATATVRIVRPRHG